MSAYYLKNIYILGEIEESLESLLVVEPLGWLFSSRRKCQLCVYHKTTDLQGSQSFHTQDLAEPPEQNFLWFPCIFAQFLMCYLDFR